MEENFVNNSTTDVVTTSDSSDSMFTMLIKTVFVVVLGGLLVKLFRKAVNWFKEGQRLRREEAERKNKAAFDDLVEKKTQEKLDAILAEQVKAKEQSEEKKD